MNNNLQEKFNIIKSLGWVKSLRRGTTGIGYTFETLLGKTEETFELPDFEGIEIKTKHAFSNTFITLFNVTPDGEYLFPLDHLRDNYGYPDKTIPNIKVFQYSIQNPSSRLLYLKFSLFVDRKSKKIFLRIFNCKTMKMDKSISWSFEYLEKRLCLKLSMLAIVEADSKFIGNEEYFYYKSMELYRFKSFDNFLRLVETGKIRVTFKLGVYKYGTRYGMKRDRGTSFDILKKDIHLLFDRIC